MGEESKLLRLTLEGVSENSTRQVLIRDIQTHPVRRQFLHVDFYEVPLDHPIVVEVPVEFHGESIGVRKGGTLNPIQRTISVKCLPGEIPEKVPVDISNLDLGDSIHVADLIGSVPFELVSDKRMAIVNVAAPEGAKESSEEE
jgi:large subunit ribosomal protein L25